MKLCSKELEAMFAHQTLCHSHMLLELHTYMIFYKKMEFFYSLKHLPGFLSLPGWDPDFLAFIITLLMMLLMAAGVKKSLIFNNVLNVINLAIWVFVMTAGLFYVDTDNWTKHDGFLPNGWSGVRNFTVGLLDRKKEKENQFLYYSRIFCL